MRTVAEGAYDHDMERDLPIEVRESLRLMDHCISHPQEFESLSLTVCMLLLKFFYKQGAKF